MNALSPINRIDGTAPPFLLFHGTDVPVVPHAQSEAFAAALENAGIDAQCILKAGGAHTWPGMRPEVTQLADWFSGKLRVPVDRSSQEGV